MLAAGPAGPGGRVGASSRVAATSAADLLPRPGGRATGCAFRQAHPGRAGARLVWACRAHPPARSARRGQPATDCPAGGAGGRGPAGTVDRNPADASDLAAARLRLVRRTPRGQASFPFRWQPTPLWLLMGSGAGVPAVLVSQDRRAPAACAAEGQGHDEGRGSGSSAGAPAGGAGPAGRFCGVSDPAIPNLAGRLKHGWGNQPSGGCLDDPSAPAGR